MYHDMTYDTPLATRTHYDMDRRAYLVLILRQALPLILIGHPQHRLPQHLERDVGGAATH